MYRTPNPRHTRSIGRITAALIFAAIPFRVGAVAFPNETYHSLPCRPTIACTADFVPPGVVELEVIADPALDSQNRFYGTSFALYGVLLWVCASNVTKYANILRCVLWVFFATGVARLVSIYLHGVPPPPLVVLLISELVAPPVVLWWFSRVQAG